MIKEIKTMMKRHGEEFEFDVPNEMGETTYWEDIVSYMDDDIRERVFNKLAPCTKEAFLREYVKQDSDFEDIILWSEFSIELD